jgi:hypothetical protein
LLVASTPIWNLPPSDFGIFASMIPNTSSVRWSNFTCGNTALTACFDDPVPTPAAIAPPVTRMFSARRDELTAKLTTP